MKNGIERRKCRRFEIHDAKVSVKKTGLIGLFSKFSVPCTMVNLSKGGVCFETDVVFRTGQKLKIQLHAPDGLLQLVGQVRWQAKCNGNRLMHTGVQFMPFGGKSGWNSIRALKKIAVLEEAYAEKDPMATASPAARRPKKDINIDELF